MLFNAKMEVTMNSFVFLLLRCVNFADVSGRQWRRIGFASGRIYLQEEDSFDRNLQRHQQVIFLE